MLRSHFSDVLHYELPGHKVLCGKEAEAFGTGAPLSHSTPESALMTIYPNEAVPFVLRATRECDPRNREATHLFQLCILPLRELLVAASLTTWTVALGTTQRSWLTDILRGACCHIKLRQLLKQRHEPWHSHIAKHSRGWCANKSKTGCDIARRAEESLTGTHSMLSMRLRQSGPQPGPPSLGILQWHSMTSSSSCTFGAR